RLQHRRGHLRPGRPARVSLAARADRDGDGAAHAGALLARPRGSVHPRRQADRRGRAPRHERRQALMPAITPIVMPKWGLSMKEGTLNRWLVEEGAEIRVGQAIMEVETDKITGEVEAADAGLLRRRIASAGQTLPVKALLGVMAPPEVSDADLDAFVAGYVVPVEAEEEEGAAPSAYQFVDVGGIRVRYARKGDAPPTVLLIPPVRGHPSPPPL